MAAVVDIRSVVSMRYAYVIYASSACGALSLFVQDHWTQG